MTIADFDHLSADEKKTLLQKCCGSSAWVNKMLTVFPVNDLVDLLEYADEKWNECKSEDWLESFQQHPEIGNVQSIRDKFSSTASWALDEQSGAAGISESMLETLAEGNRLYRDKFGFIFIVFASGKSASDMLDILQKRLPNSAIDEIKIAAAEQISITKNRLVKLFA